MRGGVAGERQAHGIESFLDALGNADFALPGQQFHRAHLAHVHAHGIGGAAELGIERGQRRSGLFDGFFIRGRGGVGSEERLGVRCFLVHRNAHVVDRVDDVLNLLRIDDFRRQVIVDLRVGEVSLFLAARDQQLQLRLAVFRNDGAALDRRGQDGAPGRSAGLRRVLARRRTGLRRRSGFGGNRRLARYGPGGHDHSGRRRLGRGRALRRTVCLCRDAHPAVHGPRSRLFLSRRGSMAALAVTGGSGFGLVARGHWGPFQKFRTTDSQP